MITAGTWYPPPPPASYHPSAGTGGLLLAPDLTLSNPPFAPVILTTDDIRNITICARLRGQLAAAVGDRRRYWRELAAAHRLLGRSQAADDFDYLATP